MVAKSNGDLRILIRRWEIAVCANPQYKFGQKSAQNDLRRVGQPSSCSVSQLPPSLVAFKSTEQVISISMINRVSAHQPISC